MKKKKRQKHNLIERCKGTWNVFIEMMNKQDTAAYAAQSAFFILLSVVPIVSLLLAAATYLPFSQQDVLDLLMSVIPDDLTAYVADILADLYSRAGTTVISLSAITLLWSASRGIDVLIKGFQNAHGSEKSNLVKSRLIAIVYTILFIVLFALIMSVYVMVSHYYKVYIREIVEIHTIVWKILMLIRYVMGWLLFYTFILVLYVSLSADGGLSNKGDKKINFAIRIRSRMPGAAFAAVAWLVITRGVHLYIKYFPNFSVMYGSLAGIVIVMLWLYFCMYAIFIGVIINSPEIKESLTQTKKMIQ